MASENVENTVLYIKRGDSKSYALIFENKDTGAVEDITGWEVVFTAKNDPDDLDSAAIIQKIVTSHTDAVNGKTCINLSSTDTNHIGNFPFDIQIKTASAEIATILEGILSISKDITLRS